MKFLQTLNLKVTAAVAGGVIVLMGLVGAGSKTSPPPVVEAIIAIAWLALLGVGVLALWRKFGPPPTDGGTSDGGGDFGGYGRAGLDAYQHLMADQPAPPPAPGTEYPAGWDGYQVPGAYVQPHAPAPETDFDFDDLFDRRRGGE